MTRPATVTATTPTGVPPRAGRRQWAALVVLMLPVLLVSVDNTVLSFALPEISTAKNRQAGFVQAFAERGQRPPERLVVSGLRGAAAAEEAVLQLLDLDQPPTAVFAGRNDLAQGTVRALRQRGLSRSVAVVGFDDSAFMTCTDPPLTTVRQPIEMMGQAAVDLLVNQIEGAGIQRDELLFEPELVVRGSTAPAPARRTAD